MRTTDSRSTSFTWLIWEEVIGIHSFFPATGQIVLTPNPKIKKFCGYNVYTPPCKVWSGDVTLSWLATTHQEDFQGFFPECVAEGFPF